MALDGMFLRHVKNEIESSAIGARVSQIYQPNRDELVFSLRTFGGAEKLLLSARANSPRVNFCREAPENPAQPPMLCMLLRKRIGGGRLSGVRQNECDRVLMLDFDCVNELGDETSVTVVCEIMGMYSNIIAVDSNGIIIDALKRVDFTMSSKRLVLPGMKYELPLPQDRLNILNCSAEKIAEAVTAKPETLLSKAILSVVQGTSPVVCRELELKVCEGVSNKLDGDLYGRLVNALEDLKRRVENCSGEPYIIRDAVGKPIDFCFMPIEQYKGAAVCERTGGFSELLEKFYGERDSRERMRVKSQSLVKLLGNLCERISRKINKQRAELSRCENREQLRICADLLQANLHSLKRGAEYADVVNFYDENCAVLRIKLDPALSPAANAQRYYKLYRKAKNAEIALKEQLRAGAEELEYVDSVLDSVNRAESERELSQISEELTEQGYLKPQKGKRRQAQKLDPIELESSDGFKILVGRNNRQNDILTLKTAAKNDMWLHTKDIHGSHVIIVAGGREISETAIYEAACAAAYHSKARGGGKVPVDYTLARYVSKPSGAKPGMVIYVNNRTVYAQPRRINEKQ